MNTSDIGKLERLLRYFHVDCHEALGASVEAPKRIDFLANVDVAATDSFFVAFSGKRISTMMTSVAKYYFQLSDSEGRKKNLVKMPEPRDDDKEWMIFKRPEEPKEKIKISAPAPIKAVVINHVQDEFGGTRNNQIVRVEEAKPMDVVVNVPWKDWAQLDVTKNASSVDGDIAAAVAVLRMLQKVGQSSEPIKMVYNATEKVMRVVATKAIKAKELRLAPCTQKLKVYENSSNPRRVTIRVTRTTVSGASGAAVAAPAEKRKKEAKPDAKPDAMAAVAAEREKVIAGSSADYYIHPEWKLPELDEDSKVWTMKGDTSIHPYWGIRRLPPEVMKKMQQEPSHPPKRYNCSFESVQFTVCAVGVFRGDSAANTTYVTVPILTNTKDLLEEEELIIETAVKKPEVKRKESTWKTDAADQDRKRAKAAPKRPSSNANGNTDI